MLSVHVRRRGERGTQGETTNATLTSLRHLFLMSLRPGERELSIGGSTNGDILHRRAMYALSGGCCSRRVNCREVPYFTNRNSATCSVPSSSLIWSWRHDPAHVLFVF